MNILRECYFMLDKSLATIGHFYINSYLFIWKHTQCLFTVSLSWAYANLVWCCIRACAPFWQRIRVKLTQSGSPERYFLFKHCVLALCRCWRRIPAATSRAGRALRTFSAVEGCSHVSRVTCHASRVTPWYMSPAWHLNGPVVLATAQDK